MATTIRGDDNFDTGFSTAIAIVAEVTSSHAGGSSSAGWQDRVLNTEITDTKNIVTLSSNQFTLQAGTYLIEWRVPVYRVDRFGSTLHNVTTNTTVAIGSGGQSYTGDNSSDNSHGTTVTTITGATAFKITMYGASAGSSYGLGITYQSGAGQNSVYTQVIIHKIGA